MEVSRSRSSMGRCGGGVIEARRRGRRNQDVRVRNGTILNRVVELVIRRGGVAGKYHRSTNAL